MADPKEKDEDGFSTADLVKCAVLIWSATLLTVSYLGIFPSNENGQYVRGEPFNRCNGLFWH